MDVAVDPKGDVYVANLIDANGNGNIAVVTDLFCALLDPP
jgi:hypothetical protein